MQHGLLGVGYVSELINAAVRDAFVNVFFHESKIVDWIVDPLSEIHSRSTNASFLTFSI